MSRHPADDAIRAALRRNDPAAVELIWDRYARQLLAYLQAVICSRHDAEDVLQAVFVRVVRKRRHLARARRLDAYVYRIARNEASNFLRLRRRARSAVPADDSWLEPTEGGRGRHEWIEELQAALSRLPPAQREVVVLKVYEDKTFQEIGRLLDVSPNTAASRYRYAVEKLRTVLRDSTP